ncbi:MAG: TonB C-terminal domain-containing protein [Rubrivivax sp.]|nr:TonB C-terminal domain-containing protein [Rubrivivax sp.]
MASSTATERQDDLLPRAAGGASAGIAASLGAHAVLLAALAGVVQWQTQSPTVAAAELWSSVPEVAAAPPAPAPAPVPAPAPTPAPAPPAPPVPPPPAPAVKPPDIVTEQAARQRAERERLERDQRERREREAREQKERAAAAAEQRRQQQEAVADRARQEQLRRIMEGAGSTGNSPAGTAPRDAAPSASYIARLAALIRGNSVFSGEVTNNAATEVEVRTAAGGAILSRRLVKSSGNTAWDDAVLRAIDKTAKLPPDTSGRVPPTLIIAFRPKE